MAKYLKLFETHAQYEAYINGGGVVLPNVSYCEDNNEVHYNPYDPYGGHDYVEIGGVKWATMNVGANAITDNGLYFAWGETQGYTAEQVPSEKAFSWDDYKWTEDGGNTFTKYNGTDGKIVLDPEDDAVTAAWGGNWRMPTYEEYQALEDVTRNEWTTINGVNGRLFTSSDDSSKTLFFPATGSFLEGRVMNVGDDGYHWSRSLYLYDVSKTFELYFWEEYMTPSNTFGRYVGFPVRGVFGELSTETSNQ